jgi:hypothetical protein
VLDWIGLNFVPLDAKYSVLTEADYLRCMNIDFSNVLLIDRDLLGFRNPEFLDFGLQITNLILWLADKIGDIGKGDVGIRRLDLLVEINEANDEEE